MNLSLMSLTCPGCTFQLCIMWSIPWATTTSNRLGVLITEEVKKINFYDDLYYLTPKCYVPPCKGETREFWDYPLHPVYVEAVLPITASNSGQPGNEIPRAIKVRILGRMNGDGLANMQIIIQTDLIYD